MAVSLSISITQNSQSVTNNTSNVTVVLTAHWTQGSYNQYQKPGWLKIDGTTYDFTHNFNWNATTTGSEELFRKTVDVSHSTDGSKTLTCSASYTTGVSSGTVTTSASKTLTTIARESTIEAGWANLGETQTLYITQQSSSFTHSIKYKCGTKSGYIKADGSLSTTEVKHNGTNVKWTPPISFAEENTTGDRLTCTFTLTTYSGSTQIGNKRECAVTLVIPTKGFLPTISTAISDSTDCFGKYGNYVQGHSALNVTITGQGVYGSTIDESEAYEVYFESKSYFEKSVTTDVISGSGTLNIATYVKDSRNRKVADYNSIEVLPYSAPKITDLSVKRCKKDENSKTDDCLAVTFSAEVTPLNNKNSASYSIQYKKTSETNYCDPVSLGGYGYAVTNGTYVFEADTASSYDVLLTVRDDFPSLKATKPAVGSSVKKTWSMYKNGNGFAFGKVAETENTLEVSADWDVVVGGDLTVGGLTVKRNTFTRPNILDNWYFAGGGSQQGGGQFPINQRAQTTYTAGNPKQYTIDRWWAFSLGSVQVTVHGDCIELVSGGEWSQIAQTVENFASTYAGKTLTYSILFKEPTTSDTLYVRLQNDDNRTTFIPVGTMLFTGQMVVSGSSNTAFNLIDWTAGASCKIVAVKVELGTQQTLACQDADGNWVLNDAPPNYTQELLKCQRYYYESSWIACNMVYGPVHMACHVEFPVPMQRVPDVTIMSTGGAANVMSKWDSGLDTAITVRATAVTGRSIYGIQATGSAGFETGVIYLFRVVAIAE